MRVKSVITNPLLRVANTNADTSPRVLEDNNKNVIHYEEDELDQSQSQTNFDDMPMS